MSGKFFALNELKQVLDNDGRFKVSGSTAFADRQIGCVTNCKQAFLTFYLQGEFVRWHPTTFVTDARSVNNG
jgi:hypothetical protein